MPLRQRCLWHFHCTYMPCAQRHALSLAAAYTTALTSQNGSIALNNSCIRKGTSISVSGYADPVEDFAAGSYKAVVGPAPAASDCSGPNFLIQKVSSFASWLPSVP